jgi:predicted N-formylglutamate amidohydrolase
MNDAVAAPETAPTPLLGPDDPPPVTVIEAAGTVPVLVVCDHAGNRVPAGCNRLGLSEAQLAEHIGWDIGAAEVARRLARHLGAACILSAYSRLVIDCNRSLHDPTLIPPASDGIAVPGNRDLPPAAREARILGLHRPYHAAIERALDGFAARGVVPVVLSIHSFTPRMNGFDRPWQVGILWDKDPRIAVPLIAALAQAGLEVGDNQPYSARSPQGFTMASHAVERGLPHVLVELRQDEVGDAAGAERYAAILDRALAPILADPQLYRTAFYG